MTELDYEAHYEPAATAELASLAVNAGRALADEKRHYEIACQETARLQAVVARLRQMTDHWEQQLPEVIRTPAVVSAIRAALEAADEPNRMAGEAQQPTGAPCGCGHAVDEHGVYGCVDGCACEWMPKRPPMDPVHILGIGAVGAQQPETQADDKPAVCGGFQWIGQSFATCERCGQPAWDHDGEEVVAVDGAGPFDTRRTVRPWKPGEADAIRAKWGTPATAVARQADTAGEQQ